MSQEYIACLDIGTTGCRSIIYDKNGNSLIQTYEEYQSIYLSPRWIDHDPSTWLNAIENTLSEAVKSLDLDSDQIAAISVTSQRATFTPVDKDGNYLANAMLWQDKRAIKEAQYLEKEFGEYFIYEKTGLKIDPYFTLPKILWLKENKKEIYESAYKFLFVQDLAINKLTGEFVTDWTQASRSMLFNIDSLEWDYEFAEKVGIDKDKLPKAVPPGSIAGDLTSEMSEKLGINEGTPVIAAGGDQQCAAIGLGVVESKLVLANTGTGSFVLAHSENPAKDKKRRVICSASAIPGKWVLEAGIFTTGSIYRWFRDNFGVLENKLGKDLDISSYEILNAEAKKAPIGSNGLVLLPHFAASAAPYWNPEARGVLYGLELGHKRSSVIRSFLEGIALEIQKNLEIMQLITTDMEEIRVSGGTAKSSVFNQIQSNVYGKPVIRTKSEETSGLGAAILAANTIGFYPDINTAVKKMVELDSQSKRIPNIEAHKAYKKVMDLHDSIYHALNDGEVYSKSEELADYLNSNI
jgi:xylulokinase/glycerol kinase